MSHKDEQNLLLDVKNLHTGFKIDGELFHAVVDVDLKVHEKEVVCVVGESGCGKSVMSLSIMQLLPEGNAEISAGEIIFKGENLLTKTEKEMNTIRGKDISMIFQEPMTALNPVFTVGSQLQEVLHNHMKISKKEARERSIKLLRSVGIPRPEKIINEHPHQLSGGMRQRVMIAMAIALHPPLLIADEPTTALDVTVQAQILELLKYIQEKENMAIMLITHDLGVVAEMADKVVVMYAGQVVESANVIELFTNPKHPYTKALLESIPRMDEQKEQLKTIHGIVPSLTNMPKVGCRFADRCPMAFEDCQQINPELGEVLTNHHVRCLLQKESYPTESNKQKEAFSV